MYRHPLCHANIHIIVTAGVAVPEDIVVSVGSHMQQDVGFSSVFLRTDTLRMSQHDFESDKVVMRFLETPLSWV